MSSKAPLHWGCSETEGILLGVISDMLAGQPFGFVRCDRVLSRIDRQIGLGPRYAYELLLDLARPWLVWAPLLEVGGVAADRATPADEPYITRCRLTSVGMAILEQERGGHHLPLGIINGTIYRGGTQPPLEPSRVVAALRELIRNPRAADEVLRKIIGVPQFPSGCAASGDFDSLLMGREVLLREVGRVKITGIPVPEEAAKVGRVAGAPILVTGIVRSAPHIIIDALPGRVSATSDVIDEMQACIGPQWIGRNPSEGALPIADMRDLTENGQVRIEISLRRGSDADAVRRQLEDLDSLAHASSAEFPLPLCDLLRAWVDQHGGEGGDRDLERLEHLIADARAEIVARPDA